MIAPVAQSAIHDDDWQLCPLLPERSGALPELLTQRLNLLLETEAVQALDLNARLTLEISAHRQLEDWHLLLALTPWMLTRLLIPQNRPAWSLPEGWNAQSRRQASYQVIGPLCELDIAGNHQRAHLNYDPELGHYLMQPLILNMTPFNGNDTVFAAWNQVIRTRDAEMERTRRDCPWQREISRRELFTRRNPDAPPPSGRESKV